ncbi:MULTISPECIES: 8-oxoguanine deaminase [Nocardiaceae]|uniref:Cytosine/adenosine deaminase-related metal-dependent hydrolase n=1 Tax=Rhodococcoides corynebacterioides TaxID=53972 RepID=A0ABS2KSX2_9NOCA|nr:MULTISPECIES: 8-oxoguanine deaminase [Rhodococcus]MBM7414993.1 cytosine/adenosine deaminase-related metal-dependent hydrolase [Rhodococcus corynebacterioides]MBP1117455.1 cytosine/adenosine deaminase-related metal-dependent hydrolase [Rhodococcus sp. PvP016]
MSIRIVTNAYIAPVVGAEIPHGYIVVDGPLVTAIGAGPAPIVPGAEIIDARGGLVTPGLVNAHHHLYQWASQGLAKDSTLFEWLVTLYRPWAKMDAEVVGGAALAGLGWLAKSGCTTSTDHHYIFPKGRGDLFAAEIDAAARIGVRFHPCRGSMDRGVSDGGLPPDEVVEKLDDILTATADAIDTHHDASFGSMLRIAVAPCSPFSISKDLLVESASLARAKGVRLHTHLSETVDEEEHCLAQMGCTPVQYMEQVGWLGDDVWFAHAVHLHDSDITSLAATGTGVAHCPSSNARLGAGIARVADLLRAGAPVGLGVDGSASAEMVSLAGEIRQAVYMQRARYGPTALSARQALEAATLGGATVLGRQDEIGSLEVGKLADLAIWRTDGFYAAIDDPVVALAYGQTPPLGHLMVGGRTIVEDDTLVSVPQDEAAAAGASAHRRLMALAQDVL